MPGTLKYGLKNPSPRPRLMERPPALFAVAMSGLPSPFKSTTMMDFGVAPVANGVSARKLGVAFVGIAEDAYPTNYRPLFVFNEHGIWKYQDIPAGVAQRRRGWDISLK